MTYVLVDRDAWTRGDNPLRAVVEADQPEAITGLPCLDGGGGPTVPRGELTKTSDFDTSWCENGSRFAGVICRRS